MKGMSGAFGGIGGCLAFVALSSVPMVAHADPPGFEAAQAEVRQTCSAELARVRYGLEMFSPFASRGNIDPDYDFDAWASAAELRQQVYPGFLEHFNRPGDHALLACMLRVALRLAAIRESGAQTPPAQMAPEVAEAFRNAATEEIRARIVRNAAAYAASRPSLVVRANSGSACIRADMVNYRFEPGVNGTSETWTADIRLTNSCNSEQFVYAEDRMPNGRAAGMPITNVGMFRGRWDQRRDPNVGFRPYNPLGEIPRYRIRAGEEWSQAGLYRGGSTNQVELWLGSCPSHGPGNVTQIGFRPTAYMRDDPRLVCVPGIQGPDRY